MIQRRMRASTARNKVVKPEPYGAAVTKEVKVSLGRDTAHAVGARAASLTRVEGNDEGH